MMRPSITHRTARARSALLVLTILVGLFLPAATFAETKVGGHFGLVLPLVNHADGKTTDITDNFQIGFPTGITVKTSDRLAFDLELVPLVDDNPLSVDVTVHPGVIVGVGGVNVGLRAAFDVKGNAWGFTPLVAKGFPIQGQNASYFVELDFPLRVQEDAAGKNDTSFGLAFHTGIAF